MPSSIYERFPETLSSLWMCIVQMVSVVAWLAKILSLKMFSNVFAVIKMLWDYPVETLLVVLFVIFVYNVFLYLGFGQKRSIKLSAPYLDHAYYIAQLQKGYSEPHHFYNLEIGPLSRPMYCIACREAITGLFVNALCCDVCGYSVHITCIDHALPNCKSVAMFASQDDAVRFLHFVRDGVDVEPSIRSNSNPVIAPTVARRPSSSVSFNASSAESNATVSSESVFKDMDMDVDMDVDVDVASLRRRVRTRSMMDSRNSLNPRPVAPPAHTRSRSSRGTRTVTTTTATTATATTAPTLQDHAAHLVHALSPAAATSAAATAALAGAPAFPPARPRDFPLWHRWLQGNHSTIADVCVACSQPTGSLFAMAGLHCTWCGTHVHERCLATLSSDDALAHRRYCSMGPLARLLVPPYALFPAQGHTIASARHALATQYTHTAMARAQAGGAQPVVEPLFEFALPAWCSPLLVFINRKSGGNRGVQLMHDFAELLNPLQVWDLADHPPQVALSLFRNLPRLRVLCCGGDGTVAWVLSALDALGVTAPVAVMPLGTGNDLAQVLGWGGSCPADALSYVLHRVQESGVAVLDRWDAVVEDLEVVDEAATGAAGRMVMTATQGDARVAGSSGRERVSGTCMFAEPPCTPPSRAPTPTCRQADGPPVQSTRAPVAARPLPDTTPAQTKTFRDLISRAAAPLTRVLHAIDTVLPLLAPAPVGAGPRTCVVNNYMGFGIDAVIAHQFHALRCSHPHLFQHQLVNKAWYARIGTEQSVAPYMRGGLRARGVRLYVDGREVPVGEFQGICVLNIKSFGGGSNFWGESPDDHVQPHAPQTVLADAHSCAGGVTAPTSAHACAPLQAFAPPRMDDGLVEVVGFRHSLHMLLIQQGRVLPERLAQGREVIVATDGPLPIQVDGEPWGVKERCRIRISLRGQALMLAPANGTPALLRHVNASLTRTLEDVLHWGSAQGLLQPTQRDALLTEFSKRYSKLVPSSTYYSPAPVDED